MAIARKNEIKKGVSLYVTELRKTSTLITGADLKAMGYPPGARFKDILNELLTAHLDGMVQTRQEEEAFILHHFPLPETPATE
jgi:tRNA nucleotidyltransferase (CCA-adding enzyme)